MNTTIDNKEDLNGGRATQQLKDDELKSVSGGECVDEESGTHVCKKCGFVYFGIRNQYERQYYENLHRQMGCDEPL